MSEGYDYLHENVTYVASVIPRKTGLKSPRVPSVQPKIYEVATENWAKSDQLQALLFKGTQVNHEQVFL